MIEAQGQVQAQRVFSFFIDRPTHAYQDAKQTAIDQAEGTQRLDFLDFQPGGGMHQVSKQAR